MIKKYSHPLLTGKPCMIHENFTPYMDAICEGLELINAYMQINNSGRAPKDKLNGTVVKPASKSCHFVYEAVDGNIVDKSGVTWTNEMMLGKLSNDIEAFIKYITERGVRWGKSFKDGIHYDSDLYHRDPEKWEQQFNEIHNPPTV